MKGQGERGRGGSSEGSEKNKGVFTCLWNQQLAALSHNLRHMDVIRTTVSVCARSPVFALQAPGDSHVFVGCCNEQSQPNPSARVLRAACSDTAQKLYLSGSQAVDVGCVTVFVWPVVTFCPSAHTHTSWLAGWSDSSSARSVYVREFECRNGSGAHSNCPIMHNPVQTALNGETHKVLPPLPAGRRVALSNCVCSVDGCLRLESEITLYLSSFKPTSPKTNQLRMKNSNIGAQIYNGKCTV